MAELRDGQQQGVGGKLNLHSHLMPMARWHPFQFLAGDRGFFYSLEKVIQCCLGGSSFFSL